MATITRRVATDVGGTFTDLVCYETDTATGATRIITAKSDTTPPDFETGVLDVMAKGGINPATVEFLAHGTTVVINALTERKGVTVGLITTLGFRDTLEIARGNRPDLFNFLFKKSPPFVPRHLRLEVSERPDHHGREITPVALVDVASALAVFRREGVQAIAVCFLHA